MENTDIIKLPMVFPIALHQTINFGLNEFAQFAQFHFCPIVTSDTKKKEEELIKNHKKIPWGIHDLGWGNGDYIKTSLEVLQTGGGVFVSPHAQRVESLIPWNIHPVGLLDVNIRRHKIDKVAYFFATLSTENNNYMADGYRYFEPYGIRLTSPFPTSDFREFAATQGGLDKTAYDILYRISQHTYRP